MAPLCCSPLCMAWGVAEATCSPGSGQIKHLFFAELDCDGFGHLDALLRPPFPWLWQETGLLG